jgi:hypothetical protein
MSEMLTFRARNRLPEDYVAQMEGNMVTEKDIDIIIRGPARILKPDGTPLLVYLPEAISEELKAESYPILHKLKGSYTSNRGMAAGGARVMGPSKRSYARSVDSAMIGASDPQGQRRYCRLTAWTRDSWDEWKGLWPLLYEIARNLEENVPERYANQAKKARQTSPEWVIPGTPFTTVTVNNTYATSVHTDKGDLHEGFSTLVVFREGNYKGGWLCLPAFKIAIDMQDRDLLLMDAHEFHGNTPFDPEPARNANGSLAEDPGFERVSIVSYFRTKMTECGTMAEEAERAQVYAENRLAAMVGGE